MSTQEKERKKRRREENEGLVQVWRRNFIFHCKTSNIDAESGESK